MSPQLPPELFDNIIGHLSFDNETLLSLVSASRQFKRARRHFYRRVCITFEPRNRKRGLPLYRFQELLSLYGAEIIPHVESIELRQVMLIMKGSYRRRNDVVKLREVLELLTGLSDMQLEFRFSASTAGINYMFKALASALASPRIQSMTLVGAAYRSYPEQSSQLLLSQFPGLKTLVLCHCPPETLEAFRFPSEHGIEHLYILPWALPCSSADLHSSRVGPPSASWKWGWIIESVYPSLTVQLLQNLTVVIVDARTFETIDALLMSMASSLSPGIRVQMIGFVFASAYYKGPLASRSEAQAWALFFTLASTSGVKTLCFTLAPYKEVVPIAIAKRSLKLFRSQSEELATGEL